MHIIKIPITLILLFLFAFSASPMIMGTGYAKATTSQKNNLSYADIADLSEAAPIIATVRVLSMKTVERPATEGATAKIKYHLVTGKIESLIRGKDGLPSKVYFLIEKPKSAKTANESANSGWQRNQTALIYAKQGNQPSALQLVSRNAAQKWSAEAEATTRAVTTELLSANSPPQIIGIGDVFHVTGTIAGESETQIFLKTITGSPVSISILHRPGNSIKWGVSLGEIVDDAAVPPTSNTLLWYRLACSLPTTLPLQSTDNLPVLDAEAARSDYRFVMESLGSCGRTL